jgi:four helix bundle protein
MSTYRELLIWQKSMILVTEVYSLTKTFPKEEIYGISSQLRLCAISIPSNIAEGFGRDGIKTI